MFCEKPTHFMVSSNTHLGEFHSLSPYHTIKRDIVVKAVTLPQ